MQEQAEEMQRVWTVSQHQVPMCRSKMEKQLQFLSEFQGPLDRKRSLVANAFLEVRNPSFLLMPLSVRVAMPTAGPQQSRPL
jgi:hypothetical protein